MKDHPLCKALLSVAMLFALPCFAQYPTVCPTVGSRANSNGQANSCPNVSATPFAANFAGTPYQTVPVGSKTGNFTVRYAGVNAATLLPYAITTVYITTAGTTNILNVPFGPAGVPATSGSDALVSYCFYNTNLPTTGTLSIEFTNPQTGVASGICSWDASCNAACVVVANPAVLPVNLSLFKADYNNGAVSINWSTAQEINNKGFAVERSIDGKNFNQLAFVNAVNSNGYSSSKQNYLYTDNVAGLNNNVALYRLKQVDNDLKFSYSQTVKVAFKKSTKNLMVVSTAANCINITVADNVLLTYQLQVYNLQGKIIANQQNIATKNQSVKNIPPGMYLVNIITGNQTTIHKVMVQ
jgi:Secretion system C-terminal sorting domain